MIKLYCEICNWKKFFNTEEEIDLIQFNKSSVQKNIPKLNQGKLDKGGQKDLQQFYKCPNCGRLVKVKK